MSSTAESSGSIYISPVANRISPFHLFGTDTTTKAVKRTSTIVVEDRGNTCDCSSHVCWCDRIGQKRQKFIPRVGSHPDIFTSDNLIKGLDLNKYGSVTKDIEALIAERKSYMISTPTNSSKVLNVKKNPRNGDLSPENSALPDIITDEDEDLSSQKISSAPPDTGTRKAIAEMLTENEDLHCAQGQCWRKENVCSARNTEVQKEQGIYLDVEAKDEMEDTSEQNDVNYDSLSKNVEVNQDSGLNLGVKGENGMEEGNALTVLSCEDLTKISETNEGMDLGLKAEGGMEEGNGKSSANSGGPPKVSEVYMDRVVDLDIEVENGMKKGNRHTSSNYEHLAKIPEIDTCNANIGLEVRDVVEEDTGQNVYDCEGQAKISESNKDKDVCVGFKDDEELEEENGQLDSSFDACWKISKINEDKGVYVGMEDDKQVEEDNEQLEAGYYDIANIWNEMAIALECSKDTAVDSLNEQHAIEDAEGCDHSFILKEDIGYVCRICGFVQRAIETIIEFQYAKAKRSGRTYRYEGSSGKDLEQTKALSGVKLPDHDYSAFELAIHPRHRKLMKPHQVEGFKFLLSNLVTDNPRGCIMAHAPGSGKTFMVISFLQSFMAKYPAARPLIVLPRGILSTWKKEFRRWQVEDIQLYDFYSSKADIRSQQLQILQRWVSERSILFLGYKQFSSIVCDSDTSNIASECEEILLTSPSILILDEGHTPRNQDTDILKSLEKVQTPRKVVLSGTLYQNHVEEVFNILNLVRPRFLKLDGSKMIKRRILSRVQISGRKRSLKRFSNDDFYDAVESTLLKDESFSRKVAVIQDLREMTSKVLHYYKGDSLDELPGLVDFTIFLELSPKQKAEVTELKKIKNRFKRNSGGSNIYVHPLLKTLSNSGMKERVDDHKIDLILEKLDEREGVKTKFYLNLLHLCESSGEKLLVFSQYLLPLKFLERLTVKVMGYSLGKEIFMITGDSDSELRDSYMELFNNSSAARVFFGSIRACGEGISLVGASRIIILDVHLNPSVTRQAIGRAFRPGQVRKVYTYRLVASDSPEVDDHLTCFRKETISKMWFEWNGCLGEHDFEMERVHVKDSGDLFLETPRLSGDVISVFKR